MFPFDISAVWRVIKGTWKEIAILALVLTVWHVSNKASHWHDQTEIAQVGREADRKAYEAATAKAEAKNVAEVQKIQEQWQQKVTKIEGDYDAQLASAKSDVASYVSRLREAYAAARATGDTGISRVPFAAGGSEATSRDSPTSLIPVPESDLYICAANTVKAEQWQQFYGGLRQKWPTGTERK